MALKRLQELIPMSTAVEGLRDIACTEDHPLGDIALKRLQELIPTMKRDELYHLFHYGNSLHDMAVRRLQELIPTMTSKEALSEVVNWSWTRPPLFHMAVRRLQKLIQTMTRDELREVISCEKGEPLQETALKPLQEMALKRLTKLEGGKKP